MLIYDIDVMDGMGVISVALNNKDLGRLALYIKDCKNLIEENQILIEELREACNNCGTCDYKKLNANREEGHCYMFKDVPTEVCMQHTGRKSDIGKLVKLVSEWDTKFGCSKRGLG